MAMMRAAHFGPMAMRPPRMIREEKSEVSKTKTEAPKPLMSIKTHDAREFISGRPTPAPAGMGLGSRYPRGGRNDLEPPASLRHPPREPNRPLKRPGSSFQVCSFLCQLLFK